MAHFYSMNELQDEPVFLPYHDDGRLLEETVALSAEEWRNRYVSMREIYTKYCWFYSPICNNVLQMQRLLRRLCAHCLEAEGKLEHHPENVTDFPNIRDLDLHLGLITPEEYAMLEDAERTATERTTKTDNHVNATLDEICAEIIAIKPE